MVPVNLHLHRIAEGSEPHDPQGDPRNKTHLAEPLKHGSVTLTAQNSRLLAWFETV